MHTIAEWNTRVGPFGRKADFEIEFRPPLTTAWKTELPRPYKFGDGTRVGSGDRIFVTVRGDGVSCYDADSGELVNSFERCRIEEQPNILFAFERAWIPAEIQDVSDELPCRRFTSVIDRDGSSIRRIRFDHVGACGVVGPAGSQRFFSPSGTFTADDPLNFSPFPEKFVGSFSSGTSVLGRLPTVGERRLACWDVEARSFAWIGRDVLRTPVSRPVFSSKRTIGVLDPEGAGRELRLYRGDDGSLLESVPFQSSGHPSFLVSERLSRAFAVEGDALVCRDTNTGATLWSFRFESSPSPRHLIGTGDLLWFAMSWAKGRGVDRGYLLCFDKLSGEVVWAKELAAALWSSEMSLIGGGLQLMVGRKMCCFRPAS